MGPSFQTAPLREYSTGFRRVAEQIARLVRNDVPNSQIKQEKGSYSIVASSSQERIAKVVIYEEHLKKRPKGEFPLRNDGVYVLIRTNGRAAVNVWEDITPIELPDLFARMNREETIAIYPHHNERFAYFPVMAGENLGRIAVLLSACASA